MIERNVTININLTPEELAFEFCDMDDSGQATFFNELHRITQQWKNPLCFQLQHLTDNPLLTDGARNVMKQIGDYAISSSKEGGSESLTTPPSTRSVV